MTPFEGKILLCIVIAILAVMGIALVYKMHQLLLAIQELHRDISVIRLDNSRTMAELRRRHK